MGGGERGRKGKWDRNFWDTDSGQGGDLVAIVGGQGEWLHITQQEVSIFLRLQVRLWEQEGVGAWA